MEPIARATRRCRSPPRSIDRIETAPIPPMAAAAPIAIQKRPSRQPFRCDVGNVDPQAAGRVVALHAGDLEHERGVVVAGSDVAGGDEDVEVVSGDGGRQTALQRATPRRVAGPERYGSKASMPTATTPWLIRTFRFRHIWSSPPAPPLDWFLGFSASSPTHCRCTSLLKTHSTTPSRGGTGRSTRRGSWRVTRCHQPEEDKGLGKEGP